MYNPFGLTRNASFANCDVAMREILIRAVAKTERTGVQPSGQRRSRAGAASWPGHGASSLGGQPMTNSRSGGISRRRFVRIGSRVGLDRVTAAAPRSTRRASTSASGRRNTSRASPAPRSRHRRRLRQGRAARLQGQLSYWWTGPIEARPADRRTSSDEEFWAAWKATYPNIETDVAEHQLQRAARQAPHRAARQRRARWSCACRSSAASSSPPRATSSELKPEDVGYTDRRLLARRPEVGDLGRHDLRHPDQQRDDGLHLERQDLRGRRARSREARRRPGTTSSPTPSRSRTSSASPATAWSPSRTPATRRSASCRSSGPTAAARSTKPTRRPTYETV